MTLELFKEMLNNEEITKQKENAIIEILEFMNKHKYKKAVLSKDYNKNIHEVICRISIDGLDVIVLK